MINPRHLLRAKRWAQNPPSWRRAVLVFAVVAAALTIGLIEWLGYWPEWATAERIRRPY